MSHSTLELSKKKELYRRFRSLSERNAQRVLGYMDALEEKHPSEETLAALKESDAIVHDPSVRGFTSASEMIKAVLEHENASE